MFSKYELLYLINILDYYEPGLVRIIEYYINTYTVKTNKELKQIVSFYYNNRNKEYSKKYGNISYWDVSNITIMNGLFIDYKMGNDMNNDISRWDVSNVIDMSFMFWCLDNFNQPLNNWNTSKVTNMSAMFNCASSFNHPLNNWDVTNVTAMIFMFSKAESFNQPLDSWNVSCVTRMEKIFFNIKDFNLNQPETIKHFKKYTEQLIT